MKTQSVLVAGALLGFGFLAGCYSPKYSASRDFEKVIPVNSQVEVVADTFNGSIEVTPCDLPEIQVIAHLKSYGDSAEQADARLDSLVPEVDTKANTVTIRCKKRSGEFFSMDSVNLELKVPKTWPLKLSTSNGKVTTTNSQSPVSIETSNGQVQVTHAVGTISISTSNGKVFIEDSVGNIRAKSSNGSMKLARCTLTGECSLNTSNGGLDVSLLPSSPIQIEAETSNGKIRFDEAKMEAVKKTKSSLSGLWLGDSASEKSETASLKLDTSNGSISIKSTEDDSPTQTESKPIQLS
jgi:DUF4097 and DUF4098 domain-containing protein YvlB